MRAILIDQPGGPDVLHVGDVQSPVLGPRDIRIAVHATAVNRADLLQREGHYPPPIGASPILGLECAGVVVEAGARTTGWSPGERVMALLAGGGYAEEVVADTGSVMRIPPALSFDEAGAIPEAFLTAFSNIFMLARAKRGESILIHGGGSGVGTAATTLCKLAGMRVIVTAGSEVKCRRCLEHGADVAINYRNEDFVEKARGVDIVLDHLGASYLPRDLEALAVGGRIVIIGTMGGERVAEVDVAKLLGRRQQITGSTLRGRSLDEKAAFVSAFVVRFGDDLEAGRIRPVIDSVLPLEQAPLAHRRMASGENFGKIVLRVR
jgi:putative PIG3 family NAD(P)H quinone oxidoreductase